MASPTDTGYILASSGANAGTGNDWTNTSNINTESDSTYAEATVQLDDPSKYLVAGFPTLVPAGSTINGLEITFRAGSFSSNGLGRSSVLSFTKDGVTPIGTDVSSSDSTWSNLIVTRTYGGSTDKWGTTWTADEINNPSFGWIIKGVSTSNFITTHPRIYWVKIKVYYTPPDAPVGPPPSASSFFAFF